MLADRLYRFQQIAGSVRLYNISSRTRIQGLPHHLRRVMLGNEQNLETGNLLLLLNLPARFQTVHPWHGDIEYHDIGFQNLDFIQSLDSV